MKHIVFTADRSTVEAEPQHFKAGRIYALSPESCERWKRRNVAVDATEAEFKAQAAADAKASKAKPQRQSAQAPAQTDTPPEAETGTAAGPEGDTASSSGIAAGDDQAEG